MATPPGQDPGHDADPGFSWADHVAWLVERHGSLSATAERLSALRSYTEDIATIERALRRLRSRGQRAGGAWGDRVLAAFGLPGAVDARARWMGAYHSRFNDLPLPVCRDLVRLWDRPPLGDAPGSRVWLALSHTTCALRAGDHAAAATHLRRARASLAEAPPEARAELLLVQAFLASRNDKASVAALLSEVEPLLDRDMPRRRGPVCTPAGLTSSPIRRTARTTARAPTTPPPRPSICGSLSTRPLRSPSAAAPTGSRSPGGNRVTRMSTIVLTRAARSEASAWRRAASA